jgi:signal transduction histidine kinase
MVTYLIMSHILSKIKGLDYFLAVISYYLLLGVVILFVVIPNRVHIFHAAVNEAKLDIRANLISHLSQQMENPIKEAISAALGAMTSLEQLKTDLLSRSYDANLEIILGNIDEILRDIVESCRVSEMTLADLFILDQLEDQKLVVDMDNVNPWELVRSVSSPFSVVARSLNIRFTVDSSHPFGWPDNICLQCDKFKLSQVLRNLISNALKFTPAEGEVSIMLELVECDEDNASVDSSPNHADDAAAAETSSWIRISVQDSGAGISPDNQKKMFGQYVQFNAAQLQKGKGSGLGLWISKSKSHMYLTC